MTWPHDLWPENDVEPTCPTTCCFRVICPTWVQQGINQLWVDGTYTRREQCLWFQRLVQLHSETIGAEPPKTSDELLRQLEQLSERQGMGETA